MILQLLVESIIQLILFIINGNGDAASQITVQIPPDLFDWISNLTATVGYFLPMTDLLLVFGFWIAVVNFRIWWNLIAKLWSMLPFT